MSPPNTLHPLTFLLMVPLVTFYCFALDLYVPLMPTIAAFFQASYSDMQTTNGYLMLTIAFGQLVFGPLSDAVGRRTMLYSSLCIFLLGNMTCFYTHSFSLFILGRVLLGLGACGSYLTCFASIRDLFSDAKKCAQMFSYLNVATSTSAIIAPSIGTALGEHFGWRSIFLALFMQALVTSLLSLVFYPRTQYLKLQPMRVGNILTNYIHILIHPNYQIFTPPAAIGMSSFFALYSVSPYFYMDVHHYSKAQYSLFYGSFGIAFFTGSAICGWVLKRIGITHTLLLGLLGHLMCCLALYLESVLTPNHLWLMHSTLIGMIFSASFMVSAGIGGTMQPFSKTAGSAFALISFYKYLASFLIAKLVITYYTHSLTTFAIVFVLLNLCALGLIATYKNRLRDENINDEGQIAQQKELIEDQIL